MTELLLIAVPAACLLTCLVILGCAVAAGRADDSLRRPVTQEGNQTGTPGRDSARRPGPQTAPSRPGVAAPTTAPGPGAMREWDLEAGEYFADWSR